MDVEVKDFESDDSECEGKLDKLLGMYLCTYFPPAVTTDLAVSA